MKVIDMACPTVSVLNVVQVTTALLSRPSRQLASANAVMVTTGTACR